MYISMKCSLYVCLSECDKIAKWQFFTSRYIFLNQVFYIHGKFLCIYMSKQFIPCQCDLLTMKCFFFFCMSIYVHNFYTSRRTGDELGLDYGGVWEQTAGETTWRRTFFIPNAEEFFASILSIFSQCTACQDVRDADQAES